MIKLGQRVKDSITGFDGIVVARAEYLNGCVLLQVEPTKLNKDGSAMKAVWFDEQRLTDKSRAVAGGPQSHPPELHP